MSSASSMAAVLIDCAKKYRPLNLGVTSCCSCLKLPLPPVTGYCGHTRCITCVQSNELCPCGMIVPRELNVNTVVSDLLQKMCEKKRLRKENTLKHHKGEKIYLQLLLLNHLNKVLKAPVMKKITEYIHGIPVNSQHRLMLAYSLLEEDCFWEAIAHLVRVVCSGSKETAKPFLNTLVLSLKKMLKNHKPRKIYFEVRKYLRLHSPRSFLTRRDLECVLCTDTYLVPVTLTCGHMFCQDCIEHNLFYRMDCPLCKKKVDVSPSSLGETVIIKDALKAMGIMRKEKQRDPNYLPIFMCQSAYPFSPCPVIIKNRQFCFVTWRWLTKGMRHIGMIPTRTDNSDTFYYGTVVKVTDCVVCEDGSLILTTIGLYRFRCAAKEINGSFFEAHTEPIQDIIPTCVYGLTRLRYICNQVKLNVLNWLNHLEHEQRGKIEGWYNLSMKIFDQADDEIISAEGPAWLWIMISIMPIRADLEKLLLSERRLEKRLNAISLFLSLC